MFHPAIAHIFFMAPALVLAGGSMDTVFQWQYIDYDWPSKNVRQQAIGNGSYNYSVIAPGDVDVAEDGRIFLSFPKFDGVPATLGFVTKHEGRSGRLIQPYPDWDWFNNTCESIQTIIGFKIDECNRLWIVDSGAENHKNRCPAEMLVFNLSTNSLLRRERIPDKVRLMSQETRSSGTTIFIKTSKSNCQDVTAYIADPLSNVLIVWDGKRFNRIELYSSPPSVEAKSTTGPLSHDYELKIARLDSSQQVNPGEPPFLFFRSKNSFGSYEIDPDDLRNVQLNGTVKVSRVKKVLSRPSSIAHVFSSEGTLFMGSSNDTAIVCWNRDNVLQRKNVEYIAQDSQRLGFVSGMKVMKKPIVSDEELWVVSNRDLESSKGEINFNQYNFHILKSPVKRLINGTRCEMPKITPGDSRKSDVPLYFPGN